MSKLKKLEALADAEGIEIEEWQRKANELMKQIEGSKA